MPNKQKLRAYGAVVGAFFLMAVMHTSLQSSFSLFLLPVTEGMGIPRSLFTLCSSIVALMSLLLSPKMGKWMSGRNMHRLLVLCVSGMALTYATYGLAGNFPHLYCTAVIVGLFSSGATAIPVSIVLTSHFPKANGMAVSIAYAGTGIGGSIITPLLTDIIAAYSWRHGFFFLSAVMLAVGLPSAIFLLRPNRDALQHGKQETAASGDVLRALWKKPHFIMYLLGIFLMCFVGCGSINHFAAHVSGILDRNFGAKVFAFMLLVLSPIKIVLGLLFDKKGVRAGTLFSLLSTMISMLLLLWARQPWMMWPMAVFYALGNAICTVGPPVLTASIYGNEGYGSIFGVVNLCIMLATMSGPPASALVFDTFGSYSLAWIFGVILSAVSLILIFAADFLRKRETA